MSITENQPTMDNNEKEGKVLGSSEGWIMEQAYKATS